MGIFFHFFGGLRQPRKGLTERLRCGEPRAIFVY
jgi:hypothetical protein